MDKVKQFFNTINVLKRLRALEHNQSIIINAHNQVKKSAENRFLLLEDKLGLTLTETTKKGTHYRKKYSKKK